MRQGGRCGQLDRHRFVYMRWKEQFFVGAGSDAGLTIAGAPPRGLAQSHTCTARHSEGLRQLASDPGCERTLLSRC